MKLINNSFRLFQFGLQSKTHHRRFCGYNIFRIHQCQTDFKQVRLFSKLNYEVPDTDLRLISDTIFEIYKDNANEIQLSTLHNALLEQGIRCKTDPRFSTFQTNLADWKESKKSENLDGTKCNKDELFSLIGDSTCLEVITKTLGRQCIIPDFQSFSSKIHAIFDSVRHCDTGSLAKEDPTKFGMSLCTVDGQRIAIGDAEIPFCLQSCMKPFQYAIAVSNYTSQYVHQHIGKEPSGNMFNAIMLNQEDQPHNPMINAGALVVCSLIKPELPVAERYVHVQNIISDMAAGEYTSFHNAVFQSEKATSYRNFALAYLLKEKNCFADGTSVEETVDLYLQLCAFKMTCSSASVAAATLANGGVCPLKPERRILNSDAVRNTLALMHSCGMYDYSGVFAFHVGLPAKSGVAGGLMLVIPKVMGVTIWSPLLDEKGNSMRGLEFCRELVEQYNLHAYDNLRYSERKSDPRVLKRALTDNEICLLSSYAQLKSIERQHTHHLNLV
ncbi:glutaminase kidney isoform, mitochondrial-like isoform X2 [Styela clava]|uniref:glutaminase kidney isoform, mitochondrial-like isoform X2 n=1 Tax=Styela clava TaxID=7725 RepID=UPI00193A9A7F|nr:glutaminase kidney isoform, mitochondrial-like isoform X2 [Styela clava]